MTDLDRSPFFRRPRAKIRRLKGLYQRKPGEPIFDNRNFLRKFAERKSNYLLGFITDPITGVLLTIWDIAVFRSNIAIAVAFFAVGVFSFTLLEYAFHRFVYHKGNTLAHAGHLMHHESPRMLLGMPWFITSGVFWLVWYVVAFHYPIHFLLSFLGGLLVGYFIYCSVHHAEHHFAFMNTWFRELNNHHKIHHTLQDVNFGVTNRFWDRAFGTLYRKETYKPKSQRMSS